MMPLHLYHMEPWEWIILYYIASLPGHQWRELFYVCFGGSNWRAIDSKNNLFSNNNSSRPHFRNKKINKPSDISLFLAYAQKNLGHPVNVDAIMEKE